MKVLDGETIKVINLFETVTKARVKDLIIRDDAIYILIEPFPGGLTPLRPMIKEFSRQISKRVEVFLYSDDPFRFIRSLFHKYNVEDMEITQEDEKIVVKVKISLKDKGRAIGRGGRNLKVINEIARRNSDIKEIKIV